MAGRRCLSNEIVGSDAFLEMSLSAQALYFHLNLNADDDGFINNSKRIMRIINAKNKDLEQLIEKRFLIVFEEEGVVVIKHWWVHNTKRSDRYKPTKYSELYEQLEIKENGVYTVLATEWQPDGTQMTRKRKEKKIKENKRKEYKSFTPPTLEEISEYCQQRNNNVNAKRFYDYYSSANWKDSKGEPVKNWKQKMIAVWESDRKEPADLPTYTATNNQAISQEEETELLHLMGRA